jgi:hypothetical protein
LLFGSIQLGASLLAFKNWPGTNFVPLQLGQVNLDDNVSINVMMPNDPKLSHADRRLALATRKSK